MAIELTRQGFEVEKLIGTGTAQVLLRAEALVPGAGREAIEPLLADATLFIDATDLQSDRVVLEGTAACQAVYRQGGETTLRALAAQAPLSQALEVPGAEAGMFSRVSGTVEHVEARYENGHMIFLVTCALRAQVLRLDAVECITSAGGRPGLETAFRTLNSVKLAAESSEMALLRETAALPPALDARTTLMDWATVELEAPVQDLGGVRIRGRVLVESLISSGAPGQSAAVVRVPLALDQLVELPEWLTGDVTAEADLRGVRTQIGMAADGQTPQLTAEVELRVRALANTTDSPTALTDIYATEGARLEVETREVTLCEGVRRARLAEAVRGTVLVGSEAGAPRVGTVIATRVNPVIGEWRGTGETGRIEGILELNVLYVPAGEERPAATQAELPFALDVPIPLDATSAIELQVLSAESSALMGDRLDVKVQLGAACETRLRRETRIVSEIVEGTPVERRPGIVILWPSEGEDAWSVARRYAIPAAQAGEVSPGQPMVLKM